MPTAAPMPLPFRSSWWKGRRLGAPDYVYRSDGDGGNASEGIVGPHRSGGSDVDLSSHDNSANRTDDRNDEDLLATAGAPDYVYRSEGEGGNASVGIFGSHGSRSSDVDVNSHDNSANRLTDDVDGFLYDGGEGPSNSVAAPAPASAVASSSSSEDSDPDLDTLMRRSAAYALGSPPPNPSNEASSSRVSTSLSDTTAGGVDDVDTAIRSISNTSAEEFENDLY